MTQLRVLLTRAKVVGFGNSYGPTRLEQLGAKLYMSFLTVSFAFIRQCRGISTVEYIEIYGFLLLLSHIELHVSRLDDLRVALSICVVGLE